MSVTAVEATIVAAQVQHSKDSIELTRLDSLPKQQQPAPRPEESPALEHGTGPELLFRGQGSRPEAAPSVVSSVTTSSDRRQGSTFEGDEDEDEEEGFPEGGWAAWRVVFGSFLGLFAIFGLTNSLGAVQAHVSLYQLSGKSDSQITWIFSVLVFFMFLFTGQVGPVYDAYGPYQLVVAGTLLWCLGLFTTSLCTEYWQFFLAFSVCVGIGGALLMTPIVAIVGHWFRRRRATAMGIACVGGSLGGVVYPLMLRKLYATVGYGWALRILAFLNLGLLVSCALFIKPRLENSTESKSPWAIVKQASRNMTDMRALRDVRFSGLVVGNLLGELGTLNGFTFLTSFAIAQGKSERFSYALLALMNTIGIFGRFLPGIFADKFGRFNTVIATGIMSFVTIFAIWLPFGRTSAGIIVFAMLHGFCNSSVLSLAPACCGQICRTRDYGKRYGTMYFIASVALLVGMPISGALIDGKNYTRLIIFDGCIYVAMTLAFVASRYAAVGFRWCKW